MERLVVEKIGQGLRRSIRNSVLKGMLDISGPIKKAVGYM